jgi:hypothetical protein
MVHTTRMKTVLVALTAMVATGVLPAGAASTGASGVFTIHNSTSEHTVTGFYTNDGTGWSTNWLSEQIEAGDTAEARFQENTGPCNQTFQVGWLGEDGDEILDEPIDIDICEASNVYLEDNDMSYD